MTGSAASGPLWDALTRAALQVEEAAHLVREDIASTDEVAVGTAGLVDALRRVVSGPPPVAGAVAATTLNRRLLRLLRRRFLEQIGSAAPTGTELGAFLLAFEQVGDLIEPTWDQRFGERLSGPDGLELVVEVAHDLRSPLTSILFLAETLLRGRSGPVTPLQERQLGLVYSAAFGLSSVASDVVELVRGRDRWAELDPMPFSIHDILESVRDIVRPIAEEKGLEVRVTMPERAVRIGHPVAINRVLLNLITNALKFTDSGHVELTAVEAEGDLVEFSVRDTGRGIPEGAMALLFEPFRRRQREREYAFSGSGLGLSICRKFVEAMGSELQVATELGKGTRFSFTLSLPEPSSAATRSAAGLSDSGPQALA